MRTSCGAILAGLLALVTTPALAAEYSVEFQGKYWAYDNSDGFELVKTSAIITTDDVLSYDWSYEGYRIRSIRGTRNGVAITGMRTESSYLNDGPLDWPNYPFLRPDNPFSYLGDFGFAFQTATGAWYNLNSYGDFNGNYGSDRQRDPLNPRGSFVVQIGSLVINRIDTAAAVPEPATWAMMIAGFGIVGMSLRRRRSGGTGLVRASVAA